MDSTCKQGLSAGDEPEDLDVVGKLLERKYRIGKHKHD